RRPCRPRRAPRGSPSRRRSRETASSRLTPARAVTENEGDTQQATRGAFGGSAAGVARSDRELETARSGLVRQVADRGVRAVVERVVHVDRLEEALVEGVLEGDDVDADTGTSDTRHDVGCVRAEGQRRGAGSLQLE